MTGLIYKEIYVMRSQMKSWLWALAILLIYAVMFHSASVLISSIAIIGLMNCLTTFTYDRMYRCDPYIAAMPVSRKKMVLSKYLFLLIMDLIVTLIAAVLIVGLLIFSKINGGELFASLGGVLGATIFLQAVTLPCIYAFGPEKARIAVVGIGFFPFLIVMFLNNIGIVLNEAFLKNLLVASPFILIAVVIISLMISVSIYERKDIV